jgi:nitroreductase/NAD-dependent dihydropyrimidine dehydrogenase PreA subunit
MNPMNLLTIDEAKCNRDGICAAECPAMIIRLKDGGGVPELVPGGEVICIECGHCVAVCPTHALSHQKVPRDDCPVIRKELEVGEEQAVQFLRSRRSIRIYKDKPVERDKLLRIIEIARYGPTGGNSQMVEWVVYDDAEKIHDLAEMTADWIRYTLDNEPEKAHFSVDFLKLFLAAWDAGQDGILRNAPALVTALAPSQVGNGIVDPVIALTYLELAAMTQGLGTCWAGLLNRAMKNDPKIRNEMGIPDEKPFFYPMMVGYPKFRYYRLPERKPPRILWR